MDDGRECRMNAGRVKTCCIYSSRATDLCEEKRRLLAMIEPEALGGIGRQIRRQLDCRERIAQERPEIWERFCTTAYTFYLHCKAPLLCKLESA